MKKLCLAMLLIALSGCATGIHMSAEEAEACKREGCSVWTDAELSRLAGFAAQKGIERGAEICKGSI